MRRAPHGTALGSIQFWVCRELKYTGKKAARAKSATHYAMSWWHTRSDTYLDTVDTDVAKRACKRYVKKQMIAPVGFFVGIFLAIFVQVIVSAVVRIILEWVFNDRTAREMLKEKEQYKYIRSLARQLHDDESLAVHALDLPEGS